MLSAVSLRWGIFMEATTGGERGSEPESLSPDIGSDWYGRVGVWLCGSVSRWGDGREGKVVDLVACPCDGSEPPAQSWGGTVGPQKANQYLPFSSGSRGAGNVQLAMADKQSRWQPHPQQGRLMSSWSCAVPPNQLQPCKSNPRVGVGVGIRMAAARQGLSVVTNRPGLSPRGAGFRGTTCTKSTVSSSILVRGPRMA